MWEDVWQFLDASLCTAFPFAEDSALRLAHVFNLVFYRYTFLRTARIRFVDVLWYFIAEHCLKAKNPRAFPRPKEVWSILRQAWEIHRTPLPDPEDRDTEIFPATKEHWQ